MDIQMLKVFYVTAQEGSISKAANQLNFAQSNVTLKIQQLEANLQTTLFYRHNRGITLTPSGQILLDYSERILHLIEEAKCAVGNSAVPSGPLHIGSMETTAAVHLPPLLAKYHSLHPEVDLSLTTGPTDKQIQAVLHYDLTGAFVAGPVEHAELEQEEVIEEELVLLTAPQHDIVSSIHEVNLRTFLVLQNGCAYRARLLRLLNEDGIIPDKVMPFGSIETIIGCVSAGLGIALMPRSFVSEAVQQGRVRIHKLQGKDVLVPTVFIWRKDALITPAFTAFLAEMRNSFKLLQER